MPSGRDGTASGKCLSEDRKLGHLVEVETSPVGESTVATLSPRLIAENLPSSICNAIYMGFNNARETVVIKLYQLFIRDSL